ncbi:glycosyltransferase [Aeoliella sp. ICT_H6.2]|uniref:Glycosyltransferase n=1 Tax=Aeoliella straminimaris TaxID=2954799 RepID=A0A9X2FGS0_9BACT|nr:glycosyltransferase [Aeoliella straminimaris]MCO6045366.1 glycosyltransferase [Aeoliella straminimaris]
MPPTISVILPVYNAERYVAEAVESILAQTYTDFEFLIIDDGSTDGSLKVLEHYAQRDERIRLKSRPNTGYVVALNEMLSEARGEFIARMDADDISLPDRLQKQTDFLVPRLDHVCVGTAVTHVDSENEVLAKLPIKRTHEEIDRAHMVENVWAVIVHPTVLIRRAALDKVGGYREEMLYIEDYDLWLRLAEIGLLENLMEPLLRYRVHLGSVCHQRICEQQERGLRALTDAYRRRQLGTPPANIRLPTSVHTRRARVRWAWWALAGGNVPLARKHAWRAVRTSPLSPASWKVLVCAMRGY